MKKTFHIVYDWKKSRRSQIKFFYHPRQMNITCSSWKMSIKEVILQKLYCSRTFCINWEKSHSGMEYERTALTAYRRVFALSRVTFRVFMTIKKSTPHCVRGPYKGVVRVGFIGAHFGSTFYVNCLLNDGFLLCLEGKTVKSRLGTRRRLTRRIMFERCTSPGDVTIPEVSLTPRDSRMQIFFAPLSFRPLLYRAKNFTLFSIDACTHCCWVFYDSRFCSEALWIQWIGFLRAYNLVVCVA